MCSKDLDREPFENCFHFHMIFHCVWNSFQINSFIKILPFVPFDKQINNIITRLIICFEFSHFNAVVDGSTNIRRMLYIMLISLCSYPKLTFKGVVCRIYKNFAIESILYRYMLIQPTQIEKIGIYFSTN